MFFMNLLGRERLFAFILKGAELNMFRGDGTWFSGNTSNELYSLTLIPIWESFCYTSILISGDCIANLN
jgi:hypothetical protein